MELLDIMRFILKGSLWLLWWEANIETLSGNCGASDQGNSSRGDKKGSDPSYILKTESTDFFRYIVCGIRENRFKKDYKVFLLRN